MGDIEEFKQHPAYIYAEKVVNKKIEANKYVIKVCQQFIDDVKNQDEAPFKYFLDLDEVDHITEMTNYINMATGLRAGETVHDSLAEFQWFFIINALCWKHKDRSEKRRYETSVLLIGRKSGKTFLVGLIFVLLLLLEPQFSEFYSVAPDKELSTLVKKEINQMISSSPMLSKHFIIHKADVQCVLNHSKFQPLATSDNRMDGRKANVFVADEVGALRNRYPIDAMQSSQMNMLNRTGILISTAYDTINNPMTEEVEYCKQLIDGIKHNDTVFALLYMPDDPKDWTSDKTLVQANPLAIDISDNLEYLKQQRQDAIDMPNKRKNFLTKHLNIFVDGDDTEIFVSHDDLIQCKLKNEFDWYGKDVYLGADLAMSFDNCGISMVTYDPMQQIFVAKTWAFFPADREEEKTKVERIDYRQYERNKWCFACGDRVVSYQFIESFVSNLENKYGVNVLGIAYDRYNAISSANKWLAEGYDTVEVMQRNGVLHPATKLLKESILSKKFAYEQNDLFENNVANARVTYDDQLNGMVNKKKSNGKIDMLAALIDAMVLWQNRIAEEGEPAESDDSLIVLG
jgi:phage terminase large subunit-like protein